MLKLTIPPALLQEFSTIEAIWFTDAETRRVDALLLAWVKYEKQLRRLFCFLVFQHPAITEAEINDVLDVLVDNRNLYPETFIRGIEKLGVPDVPRLVGAAYPHLVVEMGRIKRYRNKLMHGQVTGLSITSRQLEADVKWIVEWVAALAAGADAALGYDGLRRNTFRAAKASAHVPVAAYPFHSAATFKTWLQKV